MKRFKTLKELKQDPDVSFGFNGRAMHSNGKFNLDPKCYGLPIDSAPIGWKYEFNEPWMLVDDFYYSKKCECGFVERESIMHSDWCPMHPNNLDNNSTVINDEELLF